MKIKIVFTVFIAIVSAILVAGGVTSAWFHDEASPSSAASMVTGEVDMDIAEETVTFEGEDWIIPGDVENGEICRDFSWTFENTGSKYAFYRAKLKETYLEKDSAWAKGEEFNENQGNWAMYFEYDFDRTKNNPLVTKLKAGQHNEAGEVEVWHVSDGGDYGKLYINTSTDNDYQVGKIHLAVTDELDLIPTSGNNNPIPGQFPFVSEIDGLVESYTFELSLEGEYEYKELKGEEYDWEESETIYIALHAEVYEDKGEDCESIIWGLTEDCNCSSKDDYNWEQVDDSECEFDGYWYYREPVAPGSSVKLCLTGCLSPEAKSGKYTVELEGKAIQASHNAIDEYGGSCLDED